MLLEIVFVAVLRLPCGNPGPAFLKILIEMELGFLKKQKWVWI